MPSITNQLLKPPITQGTTTTLEVIYKAHFSPFEVKLAQMGLRFQERITVQGMDGNTATTLATFPSELVSVMPVVDRDRTLVVPRATLQEDPPGDDDEIRCEIRIVPLDLPATV